MRKSVIQSSESRKAGQTSRLTSRPIADQFSFGSTLSAFRRRKNSRQADIANAADLSPGYYSDLENNKRVAPPEETTRRIAQALDLISNEAEQLLVLAAAERAASVMKGSISPRVRRLLAAVLVAGPSLPSKTIDTMYLMLTNANDKPF